MSRRTTGRLAAGFLAAAALTGCGAAGSPSRIGTAPSPAGASAPASRAAPTPAVPAGWQRISSRGIEVDVPGDWPINSWSGCEPAPKALVERYQGAVAGCGTTESPAFRLSIESKKQQSSAPAGVPSTPDGHGSRLTLTVPSRRHDAVAVVSGPDAALVRRIAGTVRFVEVDDAGCSTERPPDPSWDPPRPGPAVTLPSPAAVAVCAYDRDLLGASTVLTGDAALDAVRTLTAAAAGPLPDRPQDCVPDLPEDGPLWLHVRGTDGSVTDVRIHYDTCRGRRVTTASGISHVTAAQLKAMLGPLHYGYGYGGDVPER
jgi:hypothetical protein